MILIPEQKLMRKEPLYKAFELLESDELYDSLYFVGERDDSLISSAEKVLDLRNL